MRNAQGTAATAPSRVGRRGTAKNSPATDDSLIVDGRRLRGVARRQKIVREALEVFGEQGYRGGSLREIAERAGITEAGILHHFGSKEALLAAVLDERDATERQQEDDWLRSLDGADRDTVDRLVLFQRPVDLVSRNARQPGILSVFARLSAEAIDPDHPAHDFFVDRYARIAAMDADVIGRSQQRGEISTNADPEDVARVVGAVMDGLQLQYLLDPDNVDMVTLFQIFLGLLGNASTTRRESVATEPEPSRSGSGDHAEP